MSKKCRAYSESRLGFEPSDNRKAFYAGWDAAMSERLAQPEQEPVAWMYTCEGDTGLPVLVHTQKDWARASWWKETPLYTAPRQWQGLTDEEIRVIALNTPIGGTNFARAIEAKLKEKNT